MIKSEAEKAFDDLVWNYASVKEIVIEIVMKTARYYHSEHRMLVLEQELQDLNIEIIAIDKDGVTVKLSTSDWHPDYPQYEEDSEEEIWCWVGALPTRIPKDLIIRSNQEDVLAEWLKSRTVSK